MNPNIVALQAAEKLLRDHDAELKDLADQIKAKKKERLPLVARVQECIDVLCGRTTPSLFDNTEDHRADGAAEYQAGSPPGPIVCAPVGAGKLVDIDGITAEDVIFFRSLGVLTLSDLERKCGGYLEDLPVYLGKHKGIFLPSHIDRITKAIERHLKPSTVPADETGVRYPNSDAWRNQGLGLMQLDDRILKKCKKEEVATLGELHDWFDEENRDKGGFFGPGVLVAELKRIARLNDAAAKANADRIYQFFADHAFLGVPDKEAA